MNFSKIKEVGYRIERGSTSAGPLAGRWWWSLVREGWSGIEHCREDFATEQEAKTSAILAYCEELSDTLQSFEDAFGTLVDTGADINGGDAVDFIAIYLKDVRAALGKVQS